MNNERMIAVSSDLIERAVSLLDLLPESGTIIELRAALATQPAAGEQHACRHRLADARNKHIATGYFCVDCGAAFAAADHAAPPAAAHGDEAVRKDAARYQWLRNRLPGSDYRVAGIVYSEGGEGVDEAIDAAMRAQAGEGGE